MVRLDEWADPSKEALPHPLTPGGICKVRERMRLTRQQFARLLNVHWVTVSKWENGRGNGPDPHRAAIGWRFRAALDRKARTDGFGTLLAGGAVAYGVFLLLKAAHDRE